jgi:hypothetical protein
MDDRKHDPLLLTALREALAGGGEHRLFKSGKQDGLFPSKSESAAAAMHDGYLELVRTETKGKASVDWVRLTPKGAELVHRYDSPRAVLEELRGLMQQARAGVPGWLDEILGQVQSLAITVSAEMQKYLERLNVLTLRVEESLRRVDAGVPPLAEPLQAIIPWAHDALRFLEVRKTDGRTDPCPLPELFEAVRGRHSNLSVPDFQQGLKRLVDNRALRLLPFTGNGLIPSPEYAIPEGAHMLYFASR